MNTAFFRFYQQLNDFLPVNKRKCFFQYVFSGRPAVKDSIEAVGVPHTEVGLILVNSSPAGFEHQIKHGDVVSVYPAFKSIDVSGMNPLHIELPEERRFVLDVHLGRLARYLRMLGFDVLYRNNYTDPEIVEIAGKERRIILTRDVGILKTGEVRWGYWLRSQQPRRQLREVVEAFDLFPDIQPFARCMACNGLIEEVHKSKIEHHLEEGTRRNFNEFHRCTKCRKIYWKGTHYTRMKTLINRLRREIAQRDC
ncbi:MAG: Mut7-C RNAse domain-containing protein [Spirochaetota bacterium]